MRIVNLETFLALPGQTLYSKYRDETFGRLEIKTGIIGHETMDFISQAIVDAFEHNSSEDYRDKLESAWKTGVSLKMDFDFAGRDGLFETNQLFAVWEKTDIAQLIARLQEVHDSMSD
jgi:hypothetical protein